MNPKTEYVKMGPEAIRMRKFLRTIINNRTGTAGKPHMVLMYIDAVMRYFEEKVVPDKMM